MVIYVKIVCGIGVFDMFIFKKGQIPWNKGLTKETDVRVKKYSKKRKKWNKESKRKLSILHKNFCKKHPEEVERLRKMAKERDSSYWNGKKRSEDTKKRISQKLSGSNHPNYGKHLSKITKERISIANTGNRWKLSNEAKRNISRGHIGLLRSDVTKKKISVKAKNQWKNPETRKKLLKGLVSRPNGLECKVQVIVSENNLPFEYVGNRAFWIERKNQNKNPDFKHKFLKKVIEVNGDYWHSKNITGLSRKEHEQNMIDFYKSQNYECLILWENDILSSRKKVVEKMKIFSE